MPIHFDKYELKNGPLLVDRIVDAPKVLELTAGYKLDYLERVIKTAVRNTLAA